MQVLARNRLQAIFSVLVILFVILFLLAAILPGRPFWLSARKFLYITLTLLMVKGFLIWKNNPGSRFLELIPFLFLFLISMLGFSRFPGYTFGIDDAYYYSYVRSVCIDGDLDLANEYQLSGLTRLQDQKTNEARTPAGYSPNIFPVGLSFFWTPFFLFGHLLANLFGLPQDGFSRVYTHTVGAGNLLYACAGLYFSYRLCAFFFTKLLSLLMTAAVLLTTPHLYLYFRVYILVSEPLSLSLIAFFLFLVYIARNKESGWIWFLVGLLLGSMTMVRFHNAVLGIVPVVILFLEGKKTFARSGPRFLAVCAGAMIGFVPQLIAWRIIYGEWFVSMGGTFLPFWKSPFVLETLFSARKGLFPWSPAALICITGLLFFFRKDRKWAWAFILVVIVTIWINSAQADWWGATSLGSRRFVPLASIFIVGLASLFVLFNNIGRAVLGVALIALVVLNLHFVSLSRAGELQPEHADRFSDFLNGPYAIFRGVVYPLQFPVQLAYNLQYKTQLYGPLNEFFIGEDIFYFQKRSEGKMLNEQSPIFGKGWKVTDALAQTSGSTSVLYVPLFMKEKPRIVVELVLVPIDTEKNVWVDFYWNGNFVRTKKIPSDGRALDLPIRSRDQRSAVNALTMHIYHARTEESAPALALRKIHFRPPNSFAETSFDEDS